MNASTGSGQTWNSGWLSEAPSAREPTIQVMPEPANMGYSVYVRDDEMMYRTTITAWAFGAERIVNVGPYWVLLTRDGRAQMLPSQRYSEPSPPPPPKPFTSTIPDPVPIAGRAIEDD